MPDIDLPAYAALPRLPEVGLANSWTTFPDADLGALSLQTDESVLAALRSVRRGTRIGLSLPLDFFTAPMLGRTKYEHVFTPMNPNVWDESLDGLYPQASSQWDGFRHVRIGEQGFYGGYTETPSTTDDRRGIHHWAERGIVGRGVLLDVAGHAEATGASFDPFAGQPIDAAGIQAIAEHQGVRIERGDVVCFRFGWPAAFTAMSPEEQQAISTPDLSTPAAPSSGLSGGEDVAELLWDWHISALVADNPAVEAVPFDMTRGSLHRRVLAGLGIPLGEYFALDALAAGLRERGGWDFLFVAAPWALRGGIGSPANAVAII